MQDHFARRRDVTCAGVHLLLDMRGVAFELLNSVEEIGAILRLAATSAGATVISDNLHPFTPNGVSGAVILAESHISIHTWPDDGIAALDVFMCGETKPEVAVLLLNTYFKPVRFEVLEILRCRADGGPMEIRPMCLAELHQLAA